MTTVAQRSFAGGEIAPTLYARVDQIKYATGLRQCRNFIVMRHGGAANRPGTTFDAEVKDSTKTVRLIQFIFNAAQTCVLEFGDLYMRIHQNGAQVLEAAKAIVGATNANPCNVQCIAHGYVTGEEVYITGCVGMTQLNGRNFKVVNVSADHFTLQYMDGTAVDSSAFGVLTSGGTVARVYTVVTPYAYTDLADLQFVQSGDVVTLTHPSYAPYNLSRTAATSWSLAAITFAPSIAAPTVPANTGAAGTTTQWVITAQSLATGEESLASVTTGTSAVPTAGAPVTVSWVASAGAKLYNVYKNIGNGVYGFIGSAGEDGTLQFIDVGNTPDTSDTPPTFTNPFTGAGNYPGAVAYFQQRLMLANNNNNTEKVWGSRIGAFKNFATSTPLKDDDSLSFTLAGRQVNAVRHMIDLGVPIVFTDAGEWSLNGDANGALTATGGVNPKQHSYCGASHLRPLVVGSNAVFVQARGSIVRDLAFDWQVDGYRGNDLTIFSAHLVDNYSLVDWAYQQIPHSIIWAVRSDGALLGLTYIREQQLWGWHRHDFDGTVENVCVVPEGLEDAVYLVIKRTINGQTKRYIERLATRQVNDIVDCIFEDCALSYDGRNKGAATMTLTSAGTWHYTDFLTLTASVNTFVASDVGNAVFLTGADGATCRCLITGFTSATVVTVQPVKDVPASLQAMAVATWSKALQTVTGLWNIEGKMVSVLGDGFVVANPNNSSYVQLTVAKGSITLDKPYAVIHVGLPITSDMETLDLDRAEGETMADKKKMIGKVTVFVEKSRGIFIGSAPAAGDNSIDNLQELKIRGEQDESYDDPIALATGTVDVIIRPEWNSNGRFLIRQSDPLPLSVLAVAPAGYIPIRGGQ